MGEYPRRVRKVSKYPALYNFDLLQKDNTRENTFVCLNLAQYLCLRLLDEYEELYLPQPLKY